MYFVKDFFYMCKCLRSKEIKPNMEQTVLEAPTVLTTNYRMQQIQCALCFMPIFYYT